jgi:predicted phage terminase large subunit-like protein
MTPTEIFLVLSGLLRTDFRAFVEKCFNYLNPGEPYRDNWHVGVIAHALAECLAGRTRRLVILLPPRFLKSTIVSVAWPAFVLGHFPEKSFICASYSQELANKLSNDTRSIMASEWYRKLFSGTVISATKDSQQVFETTQHGGRFATSVGGPMTGFGADILIIDDPQKPFDMAHESSRHKARDWLFNTAMSRFNDQKNGVMVLVMQRLHEDDIVGSIEDNPDFKIVKIPARAEEDLVYDLDTKTDYCFYAGAYLQKDRFGPNEFDAQRKSMGSREFSAQYQQDPLPADGGIFNFDWFTVCENPPEFSELIMSVDVAATDGGGKYTAVTVWGHRDRRWCLIAAHRYQFDLAKVRQTIQLLDQKYQPDLIVIDSDGIGKGLIAELKNQGLKHICSSGSRISKLQRAETIVAMVESGRVSILASAVGLAEFKKEVVSFPHGKSDDLVDSMTQLLRFPTAVIQNAQHHKRRPRRDIKSDNANLSIEVIRIGGPRRLVNYT